MRSYVFVNECKELTDAFADKAVSDLAVGLDDYNVRQYFGNQPGIFQQYSHLAYSQDHCGKIVGMIGTKSFPDADPGFLYIWSAMIANRLRGTREFGHLVETLVRGLLAIPNEFPSIVATKTYNPVVFTLLSHWEKLEGASFYPKLGAATQESPMLTLAEHIVHHVCPGLRFDSHTAVVYGGQASVAPDYFPYMQLTGDKYVDWYFDHHLTRDDQILCVLSFSENVQQYLNSKYLS